MYQGCIKRVLCCLGNPIQVPQHKTLFARYDCLGGEETKAQWCKSWWHDWCLCKKVRSILEFGSPIWNSNLTKDEVSSIERVQKSFLHIVLGQRYTSYESALETLNLETLEQRRTQLCLSFAIKASKHQKHQSWFVPNNPPGADTRSKKVQLKPPLCRLNRFAKSPIPYLTNLLNSRKWWLYNKWATSELW